MGVSWCGEVADAEAALEHSTQAVRYLLVGKDDCVRKATKVRCALHCSSLPLYPGLMPMSCVLGTLCRLCMALAGRQSIAVCAA